MRTPLGDEEIITLFWSRDEAAISEFEKKYRALCLKLARDITGCDEAAEECLNDLDLRLWNTIPPSHPQSLKSYACRIVRNLALNCLERERAGKRAGILVELDECAASVPEEETGEITALINEFLGTLPERDAMIFVRRYFYSESVREIAARLGVKENQVSKILHRLRKVLREHLEKGGISV